MDNLTEIIIKIQNGDRKAFSKLYKMFAKKVYKKCFMVTLNINDAEDIFQNIWLKLYLRINSLEYPEKFFSWFQRLIVRAIIDYSNQKSNLIQTENELLNLIYDEIENINTKLELENILKLISEKDRMLIYMHYVEGMTFKEISEITETNLSTIKMRIYRAVEKIKERYKNY